MDKKQKDKSKEDRLSMITSLTIGTYQLLLLRLLRQKLVLTSQCTQLIWNIGVFIAFDIHPYCIIVSLAFCHPIKILKLKYHNHSNSQTVTP